MAEEASKTPSEISDLPVLAPTKRSYRSFKKKYAKLKVKFAHQIKDSENLIREELRIEDLSKRIQEQNDQLLEVLLEFNESIHVPSNLRYDLSAPGDPSSAPYPDGASSLTFSGAAEAKAALETSKADMIAGRISPESHRSLEDAVKRGKAFAPKMRYTSLSSISHSVPALGELAQPEDIEFEQKLGFLTPEHEKEYYLALDAKLGDESAALQLSRAPEKPLLADREREASLRNPASVYSWLRKNQPHIFLQDNESTSEKSGSRLSNTRSSKRAPVSTRKDEDTHDEDGSFVGSVALGGSKGKRKREEDASYRPKGGGSRSRKKKELGPTGGKNNTPKKSADSAS